MAAFGEMVAILWAEGNHQAAIEVEHLWSELIPRYKLHLRCAYPLGSFAHQSYSDMFDTICSEHSAVDPPESYSALASAGERDRLVSALQQKASAVDAVVDVEDRQSEGCYTGHQVEHHGGT